MSNAKIIGLGFVILALVFSALGLSGVLKLTPEDKINSAIPVSEALMHAETAVLNHATGPNRKALERELTARLKLRALNCAKGYSPSLFTGEEEILKNFEDRACFIDTDREIAKWLGMIRAGLILAEPPLRALPTEAPKFIVADGDIANARFAAEAAVALLDTHQTIQVVDFSGGKTLYKESKESSTLGVLSPNGKLFTVGEGNKLKIRESETGNVIAEIPSVRVHQFFWADDRTAFYSAVDGKAFLVDFSTGKEVALQTNRGGVQFAAKLSGKDNQYVLFAHQLVTKIELDRSKPEPDVRLVDEKPLASASWSNGFSLTADGSKAFSNSSTLELVTLDTLRVLAFPLEPFHIQSCFATPDPDRLMLFGYTRNARGVSGRYYFFSISQKALLPVETTTGRTPRYIYIPSIKRQAQIIGNKIAVVDEVPASEAISLSQFISDSIQAVNQSKLDAFDRQQGSLGQRQGVLGSQGSAAWASSETVAPAAPTSEPLAVPGRPMAAPIGALGGLAQNARIESIGVYQGPKGTSRSAPGRNTGTVEVSVRRSSMPIVLVLSSYEPVQWNLKLEPGAKLNAVLLSGYHQSHVVGAGSARTLVMNGSFAYQLGSAGYNRLNQEVLRWTGKTIDVFQGRYEGSSFSVGG
jgi:hypothetical protein